MGILQLTQFHRQELVVPFRNLAGLVVGNPERLDLFRRQILGNDAGHIRQAELPGGPVYRVWPATMTWSWSRMIGFLKSNSRMDLTTAATAKSLWRGRAHTGGCPRASD